jgi:Winged helix-turn helix
MASQGAANTAIAQALSVSPASVANWRARFAEDGLANLGQVRKGRGREPSIPQDTIDEILNLTQELSFAGADPLELSDDGRCGWGLQGYGAAASSFRTRPDRLNPGIPRRSQRPPGPYIWTATAESMLAKVARGRIALEKVS